MAQNNHNFLSDCYIALKFSKKDLKTISLGVDTLIVRSLDFQNLALGPWFWQFCEFFLLFLNFIFLSFVISDFYFVF
jgi:hypothetical protein